MKYRPEIDGLRSIAVIPVIFFHAGYDLFSGGFIGVDIFFVISGYLITTILIEDIERKRFSLIHFYERRARRILPALFLVMAACLPLAWKLMLPSQLEDFAESIIATGLFVSNILFWTESGYFESVAEEKPLLHTWSLAVEEQYYLFFPIFLLLMWKFGKDKAFYSIILLATLSLILSEWSWRNSPTANFFLAPSRIWELLVGSIAAFILQKRPAMSSNILSLTGIGAVLFSIFYFDKSTPFPSIYALIPVIGVFLIILFADHQTYAAKFLSFKPLVGVGLISYSLYLWHQPLFAFARISSDHHMEASHFLPLIILTFILAGLSWYCVENPIRNRKRISNSFILWFSIIGTLFFVAVGFYIDKKDGFEDRFVNNASYADVFSRLEANQGMGKACAEGFVNTDECRTGKDPEVFIWGDSYAMHIVPGILEDNPDAKIQQATLSQCSPILDYAATVSINGAKKCIKFNRDVFEFLATNTSITHVVLSSPFMRLVDDKPLLSAEGSIISNGADIMKEGIKKLEQKIRDIGKIPVFITPTPVNGTDLGLCLVEKTLQNKALSLCDFKKKDIRLRVLAVNAILENMTANLINLTDYICEDDICHAAKSDAFIFRDGGHLSYEGSRALGQEMNIYSKILEYE